LLTSFSTFRMSGLNDSPSSKSKSNLLPNLTPHCRRRSCNILKREGGSDPRTPEGFGRLDSRARGVATAPARYFRPYSVSVSAIVISRRIIEMHRPLLDLIPDLIAEPPLQKSFDSGSSFSDTFLAKQPENGRQSQHARPQERERIRSSNSWSSSPY
jgi:hypothetical protein